MIFEQKFILTYFFLYFHHSKVSNFGASDFIWRFYYVGAVFCYFRNVIDEDSGTKINGIRQNIIAKPITETFGKR